MSLNINDVRLAGHLTRDPELRAIGSDKHVCNFGLAINRRYKGADGEVKEEVTFIDCEAWGRTAELVAQYLAKGSPAYCEGSLKLESWEDKEGKNRSRIKVRVDNVQFLGAPKNKSQDGAPGGGAPAPANKPAAGRPANAGDDDPPF